MVDSYVVGIDLGTTNAVLAYAAVVEGQAQALPKVLPIGQWVDQGVWQEKALLPTYRYHPLPHEQGLLLPLPFALRQLQHECPVVFGEYAVKLGARSRGQGVASAKSWLSQASQVHQDPLDAFLPWNNGPQVSSIPLVSPVLATASYLNYLQSWWNHCFAQYPLSQQKVVVTLPASFDEYARDLTLSAAELAGLSQIQFLEEPTAAAYAWLQEQGADTTTIAQAGVMCVLDIGGGTTDLSLIDFRRPQASKRLAVGDHLMLGGDNLDASIAQMALTQIQAQSSTKLQVSAQQWSQLLLSARQCKESMMAEHGPKTVSVSLLGRGKSLVAQQKKVDLNTENVRARILDGFLPILDFTTVEPPREQAKLGLVQVGLAFEQKTSITGHLLHFLQQTPLALDSVLLNGGFFQAQGFLQRLTEQVQHWASSHWQGRAIAIQKPENPQLAVALGAAFFATRDLNPTDRATIIGGGAPRSLFLQLDVRHEQDDAALSAVCVAVQGMQEGEPVVLDHLFQLALNTPVHFTLYSTTAPASGFAIGDIVAVQPAWVRLPPMQARISAPDEAISSTRVPVQLISEISRVGALQLQLKSEMQYLPYTMLEFAGRTGVVGHRIQKKNLPERWQDVVHVLELAYGPKQKKANTVSEKQLLANVRRTIDQVLGPKRQWDITLCRSLVDVLLLWAKNRRRSARHEAYWLATLGFALRPGYGVIGDSHRLEHVLDIILQPPGHHEHSVWFAWWTLVRRIAPGLDELAQQAIFVAHEAKLQALMQALHVKPQLTSLEKKRTKKSSVTLSNKQQDLKARAPEAMLQAIASFDQLRGKTWFETGLFALLNAKGIGVATPLGVNQQLLAWCFAQVAHRQAMTQGQDFQPLSAACLEPQVKLWLAQDWVAYPAFGLAASIAVQRVPDAQLDEQLCRLVEIQLEATKQPKAWQQSIRVVERCDTVLQALAGESLPQGLAL